MLCQGVDSIIYMLLMKTQTIVSKRPYRVFSDDIQERNVYFGSRSGNYLYQASTRFAESYQRARYIVRKLLSRNRRLASFYRSYDGREVVIILSPW